MSIGAEVVQENKLEQSAAKNWSMSPSTANFSTIKALLRSLEANIEALSTTALITDDYNPT